MVNKKTFPADFICIESAHVLSSLISRLVEAKINKADTASLWGTGTPCREFIYADDVAQAGYLLMRSDLQALKLLLNIGSGKDISIKKLAKKNVANVGYKGGIHWDTSKQDGTQKKLLDSSKLHQLGRRTQMGFEEGLRATYTWYSKNISSIPH